MSSKKPLVSVIIPTYNRASHVCGAIDSCLNQEYEHVEVVVSDDGSTDHTPQVLAEYVSKYGEDRIRVIRHENVGVCAARNIALDAMRGDYFQFLDSDDTIHPSKFRVQVESLQKTGHGLALCDYRNVDISKNPPKIEEVSNNVNFFEYAAKIFPVATAAPLYRASVGGGKIRFSARVWWKDEMEFNLKFSLLIDTWDYTPGCFVDYIRHLDDQFTKDYKEPENCHWEYFLGLRDYWNQMRSQIRPDKYWMLRTCWLRLANGAKRNGHAARAREICRSIASIPGALSDGPAIAKTYLSSLYTRNKPAYAPA